MFETIEIEEINNWTDAEGTVWNIEDMSTTHIKNCMKLLRRRAGAIQDSDIWAGIGFASTLNGEMAQYYAEQAIDSLIEMSAQKYVRTIPAYQTFLMELWRRRCEGSVEDHLHEIAT